MRKLCLLSITCVALSGCLVSPTEDPQIDLTKPLLVSGFVKNKSVPVIVMCEPDDVGPSPLQQLIMPSQTPTKDKNGNVVYAFSDNVTLPPVCLFRNSLQGYVDNSGQHDYQYFSANLTYAQQITRDDGTQYNSYDEVVVPSDEAKQCAVKQYSRKGTFAAIVNKCSSLINWNSNGYQVITEQVRRLDYN